MPTVKEIARRANVSVATVSRVINRTGYVSADLAARVETALAELNYQPNELARKLRRTANQTIGVLIPQLDQPFFGALCCAIERTLFEFGCRTLICSAEESLTKETAYVTLFLRQRIDGAIIVPVGHASDNVQRLQARSIPVVLVDRDLPVLMDVHRVLVDNFRGAYQAVLYLHELGHTRTGVIAPEHSHTINHRLRGAVQGFSVAGLTPDPELFLTSSTDQFDTGHALALELLRHPQPPTAIFALTDVLAVGVLAAAAELGVAIPDDLSVIGVDGVPLSRYVIPPLTTVEQPIDLLGQTASQQLIAALTEPDLPPAMIMLTPELVKRQSTGPVKR